MEERFTNKYCINHWVEWERVCLKLLGQKIYNETRSLPADYYGIKIRGYIHWGGKDE